MKYETVVTLTPSHVGSWSGNSPAAGFKVAGVALSPEVRDTRINERYTD
jgi:hypothetical protein